MQHNKEQLIHSLRTHRVNTITELRRIEKIFAHLGTPEVTEPMTSAWLHYVNSNNLLSELRGLTKNYPFSSECLDEAKWMVIGDPESSRSWNYCWLVLTKIQNMYAKQLFCFRSCLFTSFILIPEQAIDPKTRSSPCSQTGYVGRAHTFSRKHRTAG